MNDDLPIIGDPAPAGCARGLLIALGITFVAIAVISAVWGWP